MSSVVKRLAITSFQHLTSGRDELVHIHCTIFMIESQTGTVIKDYKSRNSPSASVIIYYYGIDFPETLTHQIIHRENIGKTTNELITKWNTDNPTD